MILKASHNDPNPSFLSVGFAFGLNGKLWPIFPDTSTSGRSRRRIFMADKVLPRKLACPRERVARVVGKVDRSQCDPPLPVETYLVSTGTKGASLVSPRCCSDIRRPVRGNAEILNLLESLEFLNELRSLRSPDDQ